jgi:hypothetical protein
MLVLVRLVAVLFSLSVVVRLLLSLWHALVPVRERREAPPAGVAMVRDRVCNTFLPRERALTATIDGCEEHFCSEGCRSRALLDGRVGAPHVEP